MAATDLFTLANLADQVCLNLGATDNITQARAKKYINRALIRFAEMGEWSWQRVYDQTFPTLVAGTKVYEVTSCLRIESLYLSSPVQRRLVMLQDREYRRRYPNDTATGLPYYYRHAGRGNSGSNINTLKIGLYPIPDSAYVLKWDGVRMISYLSADTDNVMNVTGMPSFMVDILIEMATAIGWKEIDDSDAAIQMQEVMVRLKAAYDKDQHDIDDRIIAAPFETEDMDKHFDPQLNPLFNE